METIRLFRRLAMTRHYFKMETSIVSLIVLGMVCLTGCREEEDSLEISISSLNFAFAGEKKVFILDSNTNWTVTVNNDATTWLTVSPVSGSKNGAVTVTADANSQKSQREATITVTAGDKVRTINVTQEGEALSVSVTSLSFPAYRDERYIAVTSNINWSVSSSNEEWLWIFYISYPDTVVVVALDNPYALQREATITVSGGDLKQTISVTQSGADAFLSVHTSDNYTTEPVENIIFESANILPKTLYIDSNTNWDVSSSESWLTVSPTSGTNRQTVEVNAETNTSTSPRTATLTFSGSGISRTINVTQEELVASLSLSDTSYNFGGNGGSQTINVYATISWEVKTDATWITVTPASGIYNGSITITAETNPFGYPRTASISVSGGELTQNFTVTQSNGTAFLTVSETSLRFPENTEQLTFNINSNTNWNVSSNRDWLSLSPSSGSGDGTVTVTVEKNLDNDNDRTADITVTGNYIQRTIRVTQEGAILQVRNSSISFSSPNTSSNYFTFLSRADWTISSDVSWLTFSRTSGSSSSGFFSLNVTASPNTSTLPRNATITVSAGGITRTASVTQVGAVSTGSISFYTNRDRGCGYIGVTLSGQGTKYIIGWSNFNPGCGGIYTASFANLPPGTYTYTASCGGYSWSGTVARVLGCHSILLE